MTFQLVQGMPQFHGAGCRAGWGWGKRGDEDRITCSITIVTLVAIATKMTKIRMSRTMINFLCSVVKWLPFLGACNPSFPAAELVAICISSVSRFFLRNALQFIPKREATITVSFFLLYSVKHHKHPQIRFVV